MPVNIAIDGPAGAGKSSAAKGLAARLGCLYMDTGALYRAVGLYCTQAGVSDLSDPALVAPCLEKINVGFESSCQGQRVLLCGRDVSDEIRTSEMGLAASAVSALPCVRAFLLDVQRDFARVHDVVMDGRDIGTVILPSADVKFFLTADAAARARRRVCELEQRGLEADYDGILADIIRRDRQDAQRDIAPLRPADDAVMLDNSEMSLEQTIDFMERVVRERTGL